MQLRNASTLFYVLLGLLMVDALIEMSFVAATVSFLHRRAGDAFQVAYNDGSFSLHGKPLHLLVDQGHTSNGAAGTALILVGIGGFLTFPLLGKSSKTGRPGLYIRVALPTWVVFSFLSTLLTLAALIYTMVVTSHHSGQVIDVQTASQLNNRPYPNQVPYPLLDWTPENWFSAVLDLNLVYTGDRNNIDEKLRIMRGWRWNLIPMFVLGLAVCALGAKEAMVVRARMMRSAARSIKVEAIESNEEESQVETPMLAQNMVQHRPQQTTPLVAPKQAQQGQIGIAS